MKKAFLILLSIIIFWSCSYEPQTSVDYTFSNKTELPISMILNHSHGILNDTIKIDAASFHVFKYSYEDIKSPPVPFYSEGIDTIIFVHSDTIQKTYFNGSPGKSPYDFDSYIGGQISDKRGIYYFSYQYDITIEQ